MALVAPRPPRVPLVYALTTRMSHDTLRDVATRYQVPGTERSQLELAEALERRIEEETDAAWEDCMAQSHDEVVDRADMDYGIRRAHTREQRALCGIMSNVDNARLRYDLYQQAVQGVDVKELCADQTLRDATPLETLRYEAERRGANGVDTMNRAKLCQAIAGK